MATSDVAVTPGSGKNIATHSFSEDAKTKEVERVVASTSAGAELLIFPPSKPVTISASLTRMTDTNVYAANDAWSNSTSAPTAGGYTFTSAARVSGGSGMIVDAAISSSNPAATTLQGEIWLFDTAPTAVNDNAAFVISDAEVKTVVAVIPFTLAAGTNNAYVGVYGPWMFTTVGSANLRALVKVKNAYTPASGEELYVRLKILQLD